MSSICNTGLFLIVLLILGQPVVNEAEAADSRGLDSYAGIHVGTADTSIDDLTSDLDLEYYLLNLGVWVSDDLSLEFRTGRGSNEDSIQGVDFEIETIYGGYGLYHYHLGELASIYGAFGLSRATIKASVPGFSGQEYENGVSFGIGMMFPYVSIEYMRYLDTNDVTADAVSVGLRYSFE